MNKEQMNGLRQAIDNLGEVMVDMDVKHEDYEIYRRIIITLQGLLYRYEAVLSKKEGG